MNVHIVNILLLVAMICLKRFLGWEIPNLVVATPLIFMAVYSIADLSFAIRKVVAGHREMNLAAKAARAFRTQAEIEENKVARRKEKQAKQHTKKRTTTQKGNPIPVKFDDENTQAGP